MKIYVALEIQLEALIIFTKKKQPFTNCDLKEKEQKCYF